jgi:hypothetical protein
LWIWKAPPGHEQLEAHVTLEAAAALALQLLPSLVGRSCQEKLNEKVLLLLATLGGSISWGPTYATTIAIDLGPPGRVTGEKVVSFNQLNDLQFSGQTLSLNFVFTSNSFVAF